MQKSLLKRPPPSFTAVLPSIVVFTSVAAPGVDIPPPLPSVLLPETVVFVSAIVPTFDMPPPLPAASLSEIVLSETINDAPE